jgi:ABC-type Fe3+ transport system substrate-binding protein
MTRTRIAVACVAVAAVAAALVVAGLAGARTNSASSRTVNTAVKGTVTMDGIWTAVEQTNFQAVIKAFNKLYPNVKVQYNPTGNDTPTKLATSIAGGHPPDIADVAQPGLVKQFVQHHNVKPITYAKGVISKNYSPSWLQLGTFSGKLYALIFKASNKSLLWYNVPAFKTAGVQAPKTWAQLLKDAKTLKASGTPAFSIGGSDGWTLTDLFENIYLRTFGPAKYDALSAHKIKWTDSSVKTALKEMGQILGDSSNIGGGTSGALQSTFNDSVTNAFTTPPKAAMVFEGDFVSGIILGTTKAKPKTGFNVTSFPTIKPGAGASGVEISGDLIITFTDNPAVEAFVKFLATPQAAAAWAAKGGFATGNHNLNPNTLANAIDRQNQKAVASAKSVVFDMSDEQPASFGATTGQGEWGIFQQFLKSPSDVNGIASKLESSAAAAYKKGK